MAAMTSVNLFKREGGVIWREQIKAIRLAEAFVLIALIVTFPLLKCSCSFLWCVFSRVHLQCVKHINRPKLQRLGVGFFHCIMKAGRPNWEQSIHTCILHTSTDSQSSYLNICSGLRHFFACCWTILLFNINFGEFGLWGYCRTRNQKKSLSC